MSTATTRRFARLEQAATGPRTGPVLVAVDQTEADRLAADQLRALIIVTGVLRAARGLQG
jgi:hypothetical protein